MSSAKTGRNEPCPCGSGKKYNPFQDQNKEASALRLKCRCVNHGHRSCQISRFRLVLSGTDFKDGFRIDRPLPLSCVQTVGYGEQFVCDAGAYTIHDVGPIQLKRSEITIHLMDSLGTEYLNTDTSSLYGKKNLIAYKFCQRSGKMRQEMRSVPHELLAVLHLENFSHQMHAGSGLYFSVSAFSTSERTSKRSFASLGICS